ncbi:hypothetical protein FPOA_12347 [Fusarium poae]|uniref:Uncharacterized protein n=1 Tax=Fusarium poae TaxID=36050 RepID=A0A1B8A9H1_FUSPO|nr:hypothetical protein FPOA_12834 [Fusarium poae]OBS17137.1 hypothetical protein FPOA_12347 [Fusarium poae]
MGLALDHQMDTRYYPNDEFNPSCWLTIDERQLKAQRIKYKHQDPYIKSFINKPTLHQNIVFLMSGLVKVCGQSILPSFILMLRLSVLISIPFGHNLEFIVARRWETPHKIMGQKSEDISPPTRNPPQKAELTFDLQPIQNLDKRWYLLYLTTRILRWDKIKAEVFLMEIRQQLRQKDVCLITFINSFGEDGL